MDLQGLTISSSEVTRALRLRICHIAAVFTLHCRDIVAWRFVDCHLRLHGLRQENIVARHVINRIVHVAVAADVGDVVGALHLHLVLTLDELLERALLAERRTRRGLAQLH